MALTQGATDPLGMFPLFLKRTADVMAPRFSVVFRRLVRLGSFRLAGDTPMSLQFRKVHPPSSSAGYTRCPGRTSVYLCAASLQNFAVPQDFFSLLSVPLERSC